MTPEPLTPSPRGPLERALPKPRLALLLAAACLAAAPAFAQNKAVKCGRHYQDRPCAGGDGRLVGTTQAQKAVAVRHEVDPLCERRGASAAKVISARQEGATEDQQLAGTTSMAEKRLISAVYRAEGDAAAQRSAIEQSCMAERLQLARGGLPGASAAK